MVSRSIVINHELHDYQPIFMELNPSTVRDMNYIQFLNGLVSDIIDSPSSLLSRVSFHIPGITRSRDPHYLAPMTRNYLVDDLLRKTMFFINSQSSYNMTFSLNFCCIHSLFFFSSLIQTKAIISLLYNIIYFNS